MSEARNYNGWIYDMIAPALGERILDIGCSIGNITQLFLDRDVVIGIDSLAESVEVIQKRFSGHNNFRAYCLNFPKGDISVLKKYNFDTIIALNVVEHMKDDEDTFRAMYRLLCSGGHVGVVAPAIKWLYGTMDQEDNHYRRYSKKELSEKLKDAGFMVLSVSYMNLLGIFGWFFNGRILKRRIIPQRQLSLFDRIVPVMRMVELRIGCPLGQSLVAIAKKP